MKNHKVIKEGTTMKRKAAAALLAALTLSMAMNVWAAPSISQIIPENPQVVSGTLTGSQQLAVQNADPSAYADKTVADTVTWANDDNTVATIKEILTRLGLDTKAEFKDIFGNKVNPTLYEQLTPFVDLVIKEGNNVSYASNGQIKAKITVEAAKEMKKEDLLLMQVDATTGKVYFMPIEEFDPVTGEITATFPTLGPITLLKKVPVVVRDTDPDKYESEKAKDLVTKFADEKKDIELSDVLDVLKEENETVPETVTIKDKEENDVEITVANYNSAMGFADLAIKQGQEDYLYDMDGTLEAEARRDLNDVDWERLVKEAYPEFDVEAAKADPSLLAELEPFTIPGSVILQVNPITGEEEYIYEPEISFAFAEEEAAEDTTEAADADTTETADADTTETTAVAEQTAAKADSTVAGTEDADQENFWEVPDEDKEEDNVLPDLVLKAEYRSMGPFALFLEK